MYSKSLFKKPNNKIKFFVLVQEQDNMREQLINNLVQECDKYDL